MSNTNEHQNDLEPVLKKHRIEVVSDEPAEAIVKSDKTPLNTLVFTRHDHNFVCMNCYFKESYLLLLPKYEKIKIDKCRMCGWPNLEYSA